MPWESGLYIEGEEPGGLFDMVKDVYRETELRPWDYWHPGLGLIKLGRMALKDR